MNKAVKNDQGKQPITLTPAEFILGMADAFKYGGNKYGLNNFRHGMVHSRCLDAALRHLLAIMRGEELDPESGLPHIYHAGCSLAMYDYMRLHYPELNDIFELTKNKETTTCNEKSTPNQTSETTKSVDSGNLRAGDLISSDEWKTILPNLDKLY